jgi:microsomal prostaglandin-E synthase 2
VLYQYESCPFCNKVRAYLDWRRIPYTVVEVDPLLKRALAFSEYKKVPLAVIDGAATGDSSAIIDALEGKLRAAGLAPGGGDGAEAAPWRAWADAVLVKHLTVNIYRSWGEALQTFDYLTQRNFPPWSAAAAKYIGAAAMVAVAGKRRKELGVAPALVAERAALAGALGELEAGLRGQPFLGGAGAGLADVSIYGVLRSIRALPTYTEAVLGHAGAAAWCARMEAAVGASQLQHRVGEK